MKTKRHDECAKRHDGYTAKELAAKYQVELKVLQLMQDPKMGKLRDFTQYLYPLSKVDADRVIKFLYGEVVAWLQSGKPVHYIPFAASKAINESLPVDCDLRAIINNSFGFDNGMKIAYFMQHGDAMILFR